MYVGDKPEVVMTHGRGSRLYDRDGREYLDFLQGWAVNALGHAPDLVRKALAEQAGRLLHAGPGFYNAPALELAQLLAERSGLDQVFLCSVGAEANEGAIKLARKWGALHRDGAHEIVCTHGAFHGRTLATMSASGKPGWQALFEPKVRGFPKVPFGDLGAMADAIGPRTAALWVEPIQGEAGVLVPPEGYLRGLRELADRHGVLLMLDEVQTGMGRTGRLFAHEHEGVRPDVMTLGKGLGAGVPLAATLARHEICCFEAGDQGGTFAQNPLLAAVGAAVVRHVDQPGFLARVRASGQRLFGALGQLANEIGGAPPRGRGLLQALPLPAPVAPEVARQALSAGLIVNAARSDSLRFAPALDVSDGDIDELTRRLRPCIIEALRAAR